MFSFCILDKEKNKIVLVRDRAGKKPLYIYKKDNCFLFSSVGAIKTLLIPYLLMKTLLKPI